MLKLQRTKLEIDVYGESYNLRRPTVEEQDNYGKEVKNLKENEQTAVLISLIDKCGLPKKIQLGMEAQHLLQVVSALMPTEKK